MTTFADVRHELSLILSAMDGLNVSRQALPKGAALATPLALIRREDTPLENAISGKTFDVTWTVTVVHGRGISDEKALDVLDTFAEPFGPHSIREAVLTRSNPPWESVRVPEVSGVEQTTVDESGMHLSIRIQIITTIRAGA